MGFENSGVRGSGGVLPAGINPGDLLVWNGVSWVDGSAPNIFQTQAAWYVDSAIGLDTNDGLTALTPLLTLENLSLRLASAILQQNTTIHVKGSFATQALQLPRIAAGFTGTVLGTATTAHAGTITGHTNWVAGTTRPNFTDAAIIDVAPYLNKRIRITAGGAIGRWAFIEKRLAATQASVSQWNIDGTVGNASDSAYVIEDLPPIGVIYYDNPDTANGFGTWSIRDCDVYKSYNNSLDTSTLFYGCRIGNGAFANLGGFSGDAFGCYFVSRTAIYGFWSLYACGNASAAALDVYASSELYTESFLGQEKIRVRGGGYAEFHTDTGIENATLGTEALLIDGGGSAYSVSQALWGTNPAVTDGAHVGGTLYYNGTKPTITGASGATVNILGSRVAWTDVPVYVNGAAVVDVNAAIDVDGSRFYANTIIPAAEQVGSYIAVANLTATLRGFLSYQYGANTNGAKFAGMKARGARGAETVVVNGDIVARFDAFAEDTVPAYVSGAHWEFYVAAAPGAGTVPMGWKLYTGNAGGGTLRWTVDDTGAWTVAAFTAGVIHSTAGGLLSSSLGAANQVFNTNGAANDTQWSTIAGDVSGSIAAMSVDKIKGATVPASPGAGAVGYALCVSAANTLVYGDDRDMIWWGALSTGNTTSARWLIPSANSTSTITSTNTSGEVVMPRAGKVVAIYGRYRTAALAASTTDWTLELDNVATADVLSLAAGVQSGSVAATTTFTAGQRLSIKSKINVGADATNSCPCVALLIQYG